MSLKCWYSLEVYVRGDNSYDVDQPLVWSITFRELGAGRVVGNAIRDVFLEVRVNSARAVTYSHLSQLNESQQLVLVRYEAQLLVGQIATERRNVPEESPHQGRVEILQPCEQIVACNTWSVRACRLYLRQWPQCDNWSRTENEC